MVLVDSSVWFAYFDIEDHQHKQASDFFSTNQDVIIMPYSVANELATVFAYSHSKELADEFVQTAINNQQIKIVDNSFPKEALYFLSFNTKMSFTDYSLACLAKNNGYQLITFDKQLEKFFKKVV